MSFRLIIPSLAAFTTLSLFSCYPWPENKPGQTPETGSVTTTEQQDIEKQRERMKKKQDLAQDKKEQEESNPTNNPDSTAEKPPVEQKKADYPFATSVPGKDGFVFSPYNSKVVDVRDIPSGTLVQDPTYPAAEKKYFRVP